MAEPGVWLVWEGSGGVSGDGGCLVCLGGVWEVSERCLEGVWVVSGGIWEGSVGYIEGF